MITLSYSCTNSRLPGERVRFGRTHSMTVAVVMASPTHEIACSYLPSLCRFAEEFRYYHDEALYDKSPYGEIYYGGSSEVEAEEYSGSAPGISWFTLTASDHADWTHGLGPSVLTTYEIGVLACNIVWNLPKLAKCDPLMQTLIDDAKIAKQRPDKLESWVVEISRHRAYYLPRAQM